MISERKLMRISLLASIAGIIMIFIAGQLSAQVIEIWRLTERDEGKQVVVNGTISSLRIDGNIFFKLNDGTGNITVVMFERTARNKNIELQNGDSAEVRGQVNIYKSELEIIASSISKV